jgi:release factor glutamine methyltransferase
MVSIQIALKEAQRELTHLSATPRLEAEILLSHCLKKPRDFLYHHDHNHLTEHQKAIFQKYVQRRLKGEPIAYITGFKEFWSHPFKVTPNTLIPRPETETLIDWALHHLSSHEALTIADLGTGCGAIAVTLALERPKWRIIATDISEKALTIAKYNAKQLGANSISFHLNRYPQNWCQCLPQNFLYSAIIANPPYIDPTDTALQPSVSAYEPSFALFADDHGLSALKTIIIEAKNYLDPHGFLALEHGYLQAKAVKQYMRDHGYQCIKTYRDLLNHDRLTVGKKHV